MGRPGSTKRRCRVVAAIQLMRIAKKMHTPRTGVAKTTRSPDMNRPGESGDFLI